MKPIDQRLADLERAVRELQAQLRLSEMGRARLQRRVEDIDEALRPVVIAKPSIRVQGAIPPTVKPRPSMHAIILAVAVAHKLPVATIKSPERTRPYVLARDEICFLCRAEGYTLGQIGNALGGRDHTTVMTASQRHAARMTKQWT